jgi:TPR repeat protein
MRGISIVGAGIALLVSSAVVRAQSLDSRETPVTNCDTYAADPFDPNRKATGVPFEKINPALAVPACESAVQEYPKNKRLAFQLGRAFDKNADYSSALIRYRQGAAQEYAPAQNALGVAYSIGNGVQKDDAQAVIWLRKAAEQGYAAAQSNLAIAYETGQGLWPDNFQAAVWHRKAAEQGVSTSQVNLGFLYLNGLGVEKNEAEAVAWYRKAAEQ